MISLGCAKNRVDSEVMLALLQERGWVPSPTDEADVVVINTCSFIREAQEESIEMILNMAAAKGNGKCRRLVVTGCLPQRFGSELVTEIPEVDLFREPVKFPGSAPSWTIFRRKIPRKRR